MIALRGLDPEIRPYAEAALASARHWGIPVTVTSTRRTWAEQTELRREYESCVARGVEGTGADGGHCLYPANVPGDSAHNYGLAWDSTVPDAHWAAWDWIRKWHGWETFPQRDRVHAQVKGWRRFRDGWSSPAG